MYVLCRMCTYCTYMYVCMCNVECVLPVNECVCATTGSVEDRYHSNFPSSLGLKPTHLSPLFYPSLLPRGTKDMSISGGIEAQLIRNTNTPFIFKFDFSIIFTHPPRSASFNL